MASQSERKLAKLLGELLHSARKGRSDKERKWKENLAWFKGDQMMDKPGWKSNTVTNFLFSQIETMVPKLGSVLPEYRITPINKEMVGQADELSRLLSRMLTRNEFIPIQYKAVTNMLLFGSGWLKVTWDPQMWLGMGDVRIEAVDPRSIYLEPGKQEVRDANYIFESRMVDKITLFRMYPDKKNVIEKIFRKHHKEGEPGYDPSQVHDLSAGEGRHATADGDPVDTSIEAYILDTASKRGRDRQSIEITEAWFFDERTIKDMQALEKNTKRLPKEELERDAYPTGRLVVFAGGEVLDDRPNPFPAFPYVQMQNYFVPGDPCSMSELDQLKPLQELYNIRSNQLNDLLNYNLSPIRLHDARSGLDTDEITNKPSQWIGVQDVDGIRQLDPPRIPGQVFDTLIKLQRDIETISGVREVTQGSVPGDVRSGYAIEQLQESADVRLQMKSRVMEAGMRELARYLTRMVGLFYIPGVHYSDGFDLKGAVPDVFIYEVAAGSNLSSSRFAQQQLIQWAYGAGIVDEEFVVQELDFKNAEDLIERMKSTWEARKQAEGQQGQPGISAVG